MKANKPAKTPPPGQSPDKSCCPTRRMREQLPPCHPWRKLYRSPHTSKAHESQPHGNSAPAEAEDSSPGRKPGVKVNKIEAPNGGDRTLELGMRKELTGDFPIAVHPGDILQE